MLDLKFIQENPEIVKKDLEKRRDFDKKKLVDELLGKNNKCKELREENNGLRHKRNSLTREISERKKKGLDVKKLLQEAKKLPEKIKKSDEEIELLEERILEILRQLPNILHESVPFGKSDEDNQEIKREGDPERMEELSVDIMSEVEKGVHACPATGSQYSRKRAKYFGPNKDKEVSKIYEIDFAVVVKKDCIKGSCIKKNCKDAIKIKYNNTEKPDKKILEIAFGRTEKFFSEFPDRVKETKENDYDLQLLFLSSPHETNFKKESKGMLFRSAVYFPNIAKAFKTNSSKELAESLSGKNWEDFKMVKRLGKSQKTDWRDLMMVANCTRASHGDLLEWLDLADFKRAAKISGAGFQFTKGDLVKLELALMSFAIDELEKKGFMPIIPPYMMKKKPYEGVVAMDDFENVMYKIENEDDYIIATSEHPITAMYMDEVLEEDQLPLKFCGISANFRREIGSHGVDTKGLFRVHQFHKIEMLIFSAAKDSWKIHEELLKNAEDLVKKMELPYRVVNVCTGDIGMVASKKYDIEVWSPRQKRYTEIVSCSNCTAYQSTALNIKVRNSSNEKEYVHTLNSTALALSRIIVAIIENYRNKDGSIRVPKCIQKYLGKKLIGRPL